MAITTLATANTTIGPAQYADMAQALAPRFLVDGPTDLQPSMRSNTITLNPGAALAAGTRLRVSGTTSVALPAGTLFSKTYVVIIRIDWSKGANDSATLTYLPWSSSMVNTTNSPDTSKINRIPGVMYDAVICQVTQGIGITFGVVDLRPWGGDGGPLRVSQGGLDQPGLIDARPGTMISTERGQYTKRLDSDGVWRDVGTPSNPWKMWTPTLRYYGSNAPDGKTDGTPVYLGTQGTYSGRYRIVDGMLDGFVQITTGSGADFGTGPITMDVPLPCAAWQADTWSMGHIYTDKSFGADKPLDWHSEVLVKAGWTRGLLFTNPSGEYSDLMFHSADVGNGKGRPKLVGAKSIGAVYTYNVTYPVE